MGLTVKRITAATYTGNGQRQVLWDDDPRGLGLRVFRRARSPLC